MSRARVLVLHPALGPLDYRVPAGMQVAPGSIVVVPIGPRQYAGVVWEAERLPTEEIGDNRLRNIMAVADAPPIPDHFAGSGDGAAVCAIAGRAANAASARIGFSMARRVARHQLLA